MGRSVVGILCIPVFIVAAGARLVDGGCQLVGDCAAQWEVGSDCWLLLKLLSFGLCFPFVLLCLECA